MNIAVGRSTVSGRVTAPPSKSFGHRMLIASFLAGCKDFGEQQGDDLSATANCLNALIRGEKILDAGESGSTLRFLLPIVCALGREVAFVGKGRLGQRPISGLATALEGGGAHIEFASGLPIFVGGRLRSGDYHVDGGVSSQYISGLLFALPLLDGDSRLYVDGMASESYIKMTLDILKRYSVRVDVTDYGYFVKGDQRYVAPDDPSVEGDWSGAAFLIVAGALAGKVFVNGLDRNSIQGDKIAFDLLRSAGCNVRFENDEIFAERSEIRPLDFDATDCPDLVPAMAVALSYADGVSRVTGVDRLGLKESDRLLATRKLLDGFGIRTEYCCDTLKIFGDPRHDPGTFDSFNDHRIAMSAAVGALRAGECVKNRSSVSIEDVKSIIFGAECVKKSYPAFWNDMKIIGADISVCREQR